MLIWMTPIVTASAPLACHLGNRLPRSGNASQSLRSFVLSDRQRSQSEPSPVITSAINQWDVYSVQTDREHASGSWMCSERVCRDKVYPYKLIYIINIYDILDIEQALINTHVHT